MHMKCTMSLMRLCLVGGDCRPRRVASLRCFSTMMPSMSSSRAMSVRSGVMGMDSVARRTLVDILKTESKHWLPFSLFRSAECIYQQIEYMLPLHLILGQILTHLPWEVVEPVEGAGVEESVSRFPEHSWHFVVVVGHELGFRRLLGKSKQAVDVLNSLESFL